MIRRDPLYKGATRPPMVKGVPIVPGAIALATIVSSSMFTSIFVNVLLLPVLLIMRAICKNDDQKFRLIGLWLMTRITDANRPFWGAASYSPSNFKKRWN